MMKDYHLYFCITSYELQEQGYTVIRENILLCQDSSIYFYIYFSFAIIYKVVIHVMGLVLAFLTRKVKLDALNDSRYSSAIIYCSCVFLFVASVLVFLVEDNNLYAILWTFLTFVEVCTFLGLTFIPKVN